MIERTCENCKNSLDKINEDGLEYLDCEWGTHAFIECQCACTDDYFEVKGYSGGRGWKLKSISP